MTPRQTPFVFFATSFTVLCLAISGCAAMDKALGRVPRTTREEQLPLRLDPIRMLVHVASAARARGGLDDVDAKRKQVSFESRPWTEVELELDDDQVKLEVTISGEAPEAEKGALMEAGRKLAFELWARAEQTLQTELAEEAERARAEALAKAEREAAEAQARAQREADARARAQLEAEQARSAPAPAFQLPSIEITTGSGSGSRAASSQPSSSLTCCVNGTGYSCPDSEAVYRCSGEFTECVMGCGMGMSCTKNCLKNHPPNPSSCSRDSNVACR